MRTVYSVITGEYPDHRNRCLFEVEEEAKIYAREIEGSVDEFTLFEEGEHPEQYTIFVIVIFVAKDGETVEYENRYTRWNYEPGWSSDGRLRVYVDSNMIDPNATRRQGYQTRVEASSQSLEQSRKAARECVAEIKTKLTKI